MKYCKHSAFAREFGLVPCLFQGLGLELAQQELFMAKLKIVDEAYKAINPDVREASGEWLM